MKIFIKEIAYALPEKVLTNEDLAKIYPEWTAEDIKKKTGISSRHIVSDGEHASDLAEKATKDLFAKSDLKPEDVDFVILITESPDYILPPTACILQDKLGIPRSAGAFDINLGCSGYIYGLAVSKGLITAGVAKNILLLTADTSSKYINPNDKSTRTLFGDAATATWVSTTGKFEIGSFDLGTDGGGYNSLIVPAGGSRLPISPETAVEQVDENGYTRNQQNLYMDGAGIFNFTLEVVPKTVSNVLEKNAVTDENIGLYIFHQANQYMLNCLRRKLKIDADRFYINMEDVGNTVSATIPIAIKRNLEDGTMPTLGNIVLTAFGVGLSWGSVVLRIEESDK